MSDSLYRLRPAEPNGLDRAHGVVIDSGQALGIDYNGTFAVAQDHPEALPNASVKAILVRNPTIDRGLEALPTGSRQPFHRMLGRAPFGGPVLPALLEDRVLLRDLTEAAVEYLERDNVVIRR